MLVRNVLGHNKNDCGIFIVDGWTDEGQAIGPLRMSGSRLVDASGNVPDGYYTDLQMTTNNFRDTVGSASLY